MRRVVRVTGALLALLSLAPAGGVRADDLQNAQDKRGQLSNQINTDKQKIQTLKGQEAADVAALGDLQRQIGAAETALAQENAHLDSILGNIDQTQRRLAAKRVELKDRQGVLNLRTRSLYKQGGVQSFLGSLFTAQNFSDLLDRFIVMRDVTHGDQLLVAQLRSDRAVIERFGAQLSADRDQQAGIVVRVRAATEALNQQYAQLSALKARLHLTELTVAQQEQQAEAALRQVDAEIAQLQEARRRAHSSGVFAWPGVQGPITQVFGCTDFRGEPPPPSGYSCPSSKPYFHTGIDVGGPYGAEIDAADGGIGYTYSSSSGYGNHVIVVHANGYVTLYGHMSRFAISSGSPVAKGQRIGYEGSTGFSSGPHLHFEVRLNNEPVNPCRYVGC